MSASREDGCGLPRLNPSDPKEWRDKMSEYRLDPTTSSISTIFDFHSASRLTEQEFLCLRILWKNRTTTQFKVDEYVSTSKLDAIDKAGFREHVAVNLEPYLALVDNITLRDMNEIGLFAAAKYYQNLVLSEVDRDATPSASETDGITVTGRPVTRSRSRWRARTAAEASKAAATPPRSRQPPSARHPRDPAPGTSVETDEDGISDIDLGSTTSGHARATPLTPAEVGPNSARGSEQVVNMALVLLLHAATAPVQELKWVDWIPRQVAFRLSPLRGNGKAVEARTDGILRARHTKPQLALAILECKAYVRRKNQKAIEWQEGAQFACLVADCPRIPFANYRGYGLLAIPKGSGLKRSTLTP